MLEENPDISDDDIVFRLPEERKFKVRRSPAFRVISECGYTRIVDALPGQVNDFSRIEDLRKRFRARQWAPVAGQCSPSTRPAPKLR
jgi:hypothetical protein